MLLIDWLIVGVFLLFLIWLAFFSNRFVKSTADFLAADRCAGRYLIAVAQGMAGLGAISIMGAFEMGYEAGFVPQWWALMSEPTPMIIAVTGWVVYRFRRTRALTMAQFLEVRYSKRFRIFYGMVAFLSGVINFGIFPSVGARFFLYFCGFPQSFMIGSVTFSSYAVIMAVIVLLALAFTLLGGQITVIATDFFQGLFVSLIFIVLIIFFYLKFDWNMLIQAIEHQPEGQSLINPFETQNVPNFNIWYFLIGIFLAFYSSMVWPGTQGYRAAGKTAHEVKMGGIVGQLRLGGPLLYILIPIAVYTILHHPEFSSTAEMINQRLAGVDQELMPTQITVPIALSYILPKGLIGAFCAVMLAAFISTHDTYLHSWGSTFIQDVVLPFRKKPFTAKQHLWLLRISICGVGAFIYFFGIFYKLNMPIFMFFFFSSSIFLAGAGAVVIGGLYWKHGTTCGAWAGMVTGMLCTFTGMVIYFRNPDFVLNPAQLSFFSMIAASFVYIVISLFKPTEVFNMDKLLHRGEYAIKGEEVKIYKTSKGLRALGLTEEFSMFDRVLFFAIVTWTLGWFIIFIAGTIFGLAFEQSKGFWPKYWRIWTIIMLVAFTTTTIWIGLGGLRDLFRMFKDLGLRIRNYEDDGMVVDEHNAGEPLEQ